MTDEEKLAHEMRVIATDECAIQQDLYKKWISTLEHKNGIEVLSTMADRLKDFIVDLSSQQSEFRATCEKMEAGHELDDQDENKMLRDLTGSYVWIFKIAEGICAHSGEQLYDLIENDELKKRIISFQNKPRAEN